jgi:hypothetical protein
MTPSALSLIFSNLRRGTLDSTFWLRATALPDRPFLPPIDAGNRRPMSDSAPEGVVWKKWKVVQHDIKFDP